jgi:Flp pilus assembly protein TadG
MRGLLGRLRRDRAGVSAMEFAILAPLFFAITVSGAEAGWLMVRSILLDRAVSDTVRLVRVGDPAAPHTQVEFKQAICEAAVVIPDCLDAVTVEMTEVASAADFPANDVTCANRGATVQPTIAYKEGSRSAIMYLRVCAIADPFTPGIGLALALPRDAKGGYRLVSTAAFMNEPG